MIRAYRERLLVRVVREEEKKQGVLIIPDQEKNYRVGQVVTAGDEVKNIREGQRVVYQKYDGLALEINGETLYIVDSKNVLAFIED